MERRAIHATEQKIKSWTSADAIVTSAGALTTSAGVIVTSAGATTHSTLGIPDECQRRPQSTLKQQLERLQAGVRKVDSADSGAIGQNAFRWTN